MQRKYGQIDFPYLRNSFLSAWLISLLYESFDDQTKLDQHKSSWNYTIREYAIQKGTMRHFAWSDCRQVDDIASLVSLALIHHALYLYLYIRH